MKTKAGGEERYRIIVNCISVKKRSGGAFQIAQNFIKSTLDNKDFEWYYWLSEDLKEFKDEFLEDILPTRVMIFPTQPDWKKTYWRVKRLLIKIEKEIEPDLIYTVASPSYFSYRAKEVMRYANAWHVNPNKFAYHKLSTKAKIRYKVYTRLQKFLIGRANYFLTQTQSSKEGIVKVTSIPHSHVEVVPNTLPDVYKGFRKEIKQDSISKNDVVNILYVAVPHPHKNLEIIPKVLKDLSMRCPSKKIIFHLTIPDSGFLLRFSEECKKLDVEEFIINHGYCSQEELILLYKNSDICFFPSLLETFSLSVLEAIYFGVPMVAADLSFNRDIAGNSILYFAPDDEKQAVDQLFRLINDDKLHEQLLLKMNDFVSNETQYFNYDASFQKTIDFFIKIINSGR